MMLSLYYELIDQRKISKFKRIIQEELDRWDKQIPAIIEEYNNRYIKDGKLLIERIVDQFYEDYDPNMYKRKEDLYNTYELYIVEEDEYEYKSDFGSKYMQYEHSGDNEIIYQNSFVAGYHGGAIGGKNHPNPGEPWWKAPPSLKYWYKPAKSWGESPYYLALNDITDYGKMLQEERDEKLLSMIMNSRNRVKSYFLELFKV